MFLRLSLAFRCTLAVLSLASCPAMADGFRCGTKLVETGDTLGVVISKCGQPLSQDDLGSVVLKGEYVNLKRVTYDLGYGKFLRILEFHNGILAEITDGPRS